VETWNNEILEDVDNSSLPLSDTLHLGACVRLVVGGIGIFQSPKDRKIMKVRVSASADVQEIMNKHPRLITHSSDLTHLTESLPSAVQVA